MTEHPSGAYPLLGDGGNGGEVTVRKQVRTLHPYGFRCGEWADIAAHGQREQDARPTWLVGFADGATDVWVADDAQGEYEFREVPLNVRLCPAAERATFLPRVDCGCYPCVTARRHSPPPGASDDSPSQGGAE